MSNFKFSVGPWNVSEGADAFGNAVRDTISLEKKITKFKEIGMDAIQFHDDDVVPNIARYSHKEIIRKAKDVRKMLDDNGLSAEFVAPRLWMDDKTTDGGFTSNSAADRQNAISRSLTAIDISDELGCDLIGLWFAREGTLCAESKDGIVAVNQIIEAINKMLEHGKSKKVFIESKPNEPIDRSFCPTMGHVMAISSATIAPERVGGMLESAHAILAGLDPANEIAFALRFGKLFGVHLNDQNGIRYDQDKTFGVENLRQAFNQIRILKENNYCAHGEYIGLDVKGMRTQKDSMSYKHLENSIKIAKILEEKAARFDYKFKDSCCELRDYDALEMYVMELLMS